MRQTTMAVTCQNRPLLSHCHLPAGENLISRCFPCHAVIDWFVSGGRLQFSLINGVVEGIHSLVFLPTLLAAPSPFCLPYSPRHLSLGSPRFGTAVLSSTISSHAALIRQSMGGLNSSPFRSSWIPQWFTTSLTQMRILMTKLTSSILS